MNGKFRAVSSAAVLLASCTPADIATAASENPPTVITCENPGRPPLGVALGYNVNALFWEEHYGDPALLSAVRSLNAPVLRVPGGTEADYFDWDAGRPVEPCRYGGCRTWDDAQLTPPSLFQRFTTFRRSTTSAFATLAQQVGGTALFVTNTVTASREDNARWLAAAAAVGVPVQRVELANEPYFGQVEGTNNTSVLFPTAESHVAFVKPLAVTLRRQSPAAQLAYPAFVPRVDVATGGISAGHDERMLTWTQRALNADIARDIDAFALHFYPRLPGRRGQSDAAYLTELSSFPEAYWRATLGTPQWKLLPTDKRLWITELNASFADAPELVGTWMHGLLQAQLAVLALQDPRMDLVLQHMLTGNPQWQAVVHPGRTPDIVPAPGYQRYALTATGESLAAVSAVVSGARCVSAIPTGQAGAVAIAAESSVRRSVVVVNAAAVSVQLDIRSVGWMTATASVVTAEPLSKIAAGGAIRRTAVVPQSPAYLYRIPPWSVTTLVRVD